MSCTVRIIAIGDELLEGRTVDSNSQRIQRALGGHAVQVAGIAVVPDTYAPIQEALEQTRAGDLVFVTGGLGSTPDDLTRDVVAQWAEVDLVVDEGLRQAMEARWRARGIPLGPTATRQSQVPQGLRPLTNPVGSAPGLVGRLKERILVILPGVPEELAGLLPVAVADLEAQNVLPPQRPMLLWRTAQVAEVSLVDRCAQVRADYPDLAWSWWLGDWGVDMRLAAHDQAGLERLSEAGKQVDRDLGQLTYCRQMKTLPQIVQDYLLDRGQTLAVAESCTGGLLGGAMTDLAGSSGYFRGGIIAYSDNVKRDLLNVPAETLVQHGAVSEATVRAMAEGCRASLNTDYAMAVSGISGPDGGTPEKPVGTTWLAIATPTQTFCRCYQFPAKRNRNRLLTVSAAVDSLRRVLEFGEDQSPWEQGDCWCGVLGAKR